VRSNGHIVTPTEAREAIPPALAAQAVATLLAWVGEDPERSGLAGTPERVARAWREITSGYELDPADVLARQFPQDDEHTTYQGIVALRSVPFASTCEHHLMPFVGTASVAYIPEPGAPLVGLSKLARLVDCFALRLQQQERLTTQIVQALVDHLNPRGAACVVRAEHSCMNLRGVKKHTGGMVTSELRGLFFDDVRARDELLALIGLPG
jgi:GTP cyclohydrolase I